MKYVFCLLVLAFLASGEAQKIPFHKPSWPCPPSGPRGCCQKQNLVHNVVPRWDTIDKRKAKSWEECCKVCQTTPGCGFWTFYPPSGSIPFGTCVIQGMTQIYQQGAISGYCPPYLKGSPDDALTLTEDSK